MLNATPLLNENYPWIPEGIKDNLVPGLDPILTYTQSKYSTITALQDSVTNVSNTINNETNNIQTEINNIVIANQRNSSKELHYKTTHTDMCQRMSLIIMFFYQRKSNAELDIQLINIMTADLRNQINNNTPGSGGGGDDSNEPDVGTM